MAATAISSDTGFGFTELVGKRTPSSHNRGRFSSRAVRDRNTGAGTPWWQPSRSSKRPSPCRAQVLAEAIREELDDKAVGPDVFWANSSDARTYAEERLQEDASEVEARQAAILQEIENEYVEKIGFLRRQEKKISRLIRFLVRELQFAARDAVDELRMRLAAAILELELIRNDLLVLQPYTP